MLEATPVEFDLRRTQLVPHLLQYVVTRETDLAGGDNTVGSHAGRPVNVPGSIQVRQTQLKGPRRQALEIGNLYVGFQWLVTSRLGTPTFGQDDTGRVRLKGRLRLIHGLKLYPHATFLQRGENVDDGGRSTLRLRLNG